MGNEFVLSQTEVVSREIPRSSEISYVRRLPCPRNPLAAVAARRPEAAVRQVAGPAPRPGGQAGYSYASAGGFAAEAPTLSRAKPKSASAAQTPTNQSPCSV